MPNELPEAFLTISRKARKEHKCCECHNVIQKGAIYIYCSGIWEGSPDSFKTCERCDRVRTLAIKKYPPDFEEEGPAFGQLKEYIREEAGIGRRRLKNRCVRSN